MNLEKLRNNKKVRLAVIGLLLLLVVYMYFRNINIGNLTTSEGIKQELQANYKPDSLEKKVWLGAAGVLGAAFGLEVANTDFDMKKLVETKGDFKASRVMRDTEGNVVTEADVKAGAKTGKFTDEYDCKDFKNRKAAQKFYDNAGGIKGDTNRLDGNKDGTPCQALPAGI
jgi:hypothetical protein